MTRLAEHKGTATARTPVVARRWFTARRGGRGINRPRLLLA